MPLKDKVSPIYETVMNSSFQNIDIPKEEFANCLDCHHCVHKKSPRAITKCCDYHPLLPNYVVGAILSDEREMLQNGIGRIERKISNKLGVTPYGIMASTAHRKLFLKTREHTGAWPQKIDIDALLCPFNDKGLCTIWDYRSELCAAFHCNSNGGEIGKKFWNLFYKYLITIEKSISIYIMRELGYPVMKLVIDRVSPKILKLDDEKEVLNQHKYDRIWDKWKNKEKEFYISCYSIFKKINPKQYVSIIGQEGQFLEEKLRLQSQVFRQNLIPEILLFERDKVISERINEHQIKVGGIGMSNVHYQLLNSFDGKTRTYDVVRQSLFMLRPLSNIILPLIKAGVLTQPEKIQ